jgi:hypothetical protein
VLTKVPTVDGHALSLDTRGCGQAEEAQRPTTQAWRGYIAGSRFLVASSAICRADRMRSPPPETRRAAACALLARLMAPSISAASATSSDSSFQPRSWAAPSAATNALLRGLREVGYLYGEHFVTEPRGGEGRPERYPSVAGELIRLQVDVIVAAGPMLAALKQTTTKSRSSWRVRTTRWAMD